MRPHLVGPLARGFPEIRQGLSGTLFLIETDTYRPFVFFTPSPWRFLFFSSHFPFFLFPCFSPGVDSLRPQGYRIADSGGNIHREIRGFHSKLHPMYPSG